MLITQAWSITDFLVTWKRDREFRILSWNDFERSNKDSNVFDYTPGRHSGTPYFPASSWIVDGKKLEKRKGGESWKRNENEKGGVADNRTTNRNGAFVSMKSGLTLCRSGMERARNGRIENEGRMERGVARVVVPMRHFTWLPIPKFPIAPRPCLLFCLFRPPFFHPFRAITNRNSSPLAY